LEDPEEEDALDEDAQEDDDDGRKAGTAGLTAIILCPHIVGSSRFFTTVGTCGPTTICV